MPTEDEIESVARLMWDVINDRPGQPPVVPLRVTPLHNVETYRGYARQILELAERVRNKRKSNP